MMEIANLSEDQLLQIIEMGLTNITNMRVRIFNSVRKPPTVREVLERSTIEKVGRSLDYFAEAPKGELRFELRDGLDLEEAPNYWMRLKHEFKLLFCSDDKKYNALRKKISAVGSKSQTAVVPIVTAALATQIGVAAGILLPFCALLLLAILRMGMNAYCSGIEFDVPVVVASKNKKKKKILLGKR
jgi:hypothetical protein